MRIKGRRIKPKTSHMWVKRTEERLFEKGEKKMSEDWYMEKGYIFWKAKITILG